MNDNEKYVAIFNTNDEITAFNANETISGSDFFDIWLNENILHTDLQQLEIPAHGVRFIKYE